MGKVGWIAIFIFCAAIGADQYFNNGDYTDSVIAVIRQIAHAFGW
jgi:hypothetical protein